MTRVRVDEKFVENGYLLDETNDSWQVHVVRIAYNTLRLLFKGDFTMFLLCTSQAFIEDVALLFLVICGVRMNAA